MIGYHDDTMPSDMAVTDFQCKVCGAFVVTFYEKGTLVVPICSICYEKQINKFQQDLK